MGNNLSRLAQALAKLSVPLEDVFLIQNILRDTSALIPGDIWGHDPYNIFAYLYEQKEDGIGGKALFDRNVVSRVVALARGRVLPQNSESAKSYRLSAACLAFCILAEIEVEPGMASYELASVKGHAEAAEELVDFVFADNVHPQFFADIALGRIDRIPRIHLNEIRADRNIAAIKLPAASLEKTILPWYHSYLHVLKAVSLLRGNLNPIQSAEAWLRWQADEAFLNASASLYCLAALSRSDLSSGMIKSGNSKHPSRLRHGVRNATWDIAYVSQWARSVIDEPCLKWLFASCDGALKTIAQAILINEEDEFEAKMLEFLVPYWGRGSAGVLCGVYSDLEKRSRDVRGRRQTLPDHFNSNHEASIRQLEIDLGIAGVV